MTIWELDENGADLTLANFSAPPIKIKHSKLTLSDQGVDGSKFRAICPKCKKGILLVRRNDTTYILEANDRCILCGQLVIYTDIEEMRRTLG